MSCEYSVDVVFCVDSTCGMSKFLPAVKAEILRFYDDIHRHLECTGRILRKYRARVIVFRNVLSHGKSILSTTKFFELPNEQNCFESYVCSIKTFGGGDIPADGLEALAKAMQSDWDYWDKGCRRICRHVIAVFSNTAPHDVRYSKGTHNYLENMPLSFQKLSSWWGDAGQPGIMDHYAKRLLLFAPDQNYWNAVSDTWDNVLHYCEDLSKIKTVRSDIMSAIFDI